MGCCPTSRRISRRLLPPMIGSPRLPRRTDALDCIGREGGMSPNKTDDPFPEIIGQHPIAAGRRSAHAWAARNGGFSRRGRVGKVIARSPSSGKHHLIPVILEAVCLREKSTSFIPGAFGKNQAAQGGPSFALRFESSTSGATRADPWHRRGRHGTQSVRPQFPGENDGPPPAG